MFSKAKKKYELLVTNAPLYLPNQSIFSEGSHGV